MPLESRDARKEIESYLEQTRKLNVFQKIWKNPMTGLVSIIFIPFIFLFDLLTPYQLNSLTLIVFAVLIAYFFILGAAPLNFELIISNGILRLDEILHGFLMRIMFSFITFAFVIISIQYLPNLVELSTIPKFLLPITPILIITFFMIFVGGILVFLFTWDTIMALVDYESRKSIADTITIYLPIVAMLISSFLNWTPLRSSLQSLLFQTNLYPMFNPIYYGIIMGSVYTLFVYYPFYKFSKVEKKNQLEALKEKESKLEAQIKDSGSKRKYTKVLEINSELRLLDRERQLIEKRKLHPHPRFIGLLSVLFSSFIIELILKYYFG